MTSPGVLGRQFETENPTGENSVYTQLPDGRWERDKKATGEKFTMDKTVFVHPDYSSPKLINGVIHGHTDGDWFPGTEIPVPKTHLSKNPKLGWTPFEVNIEKNEDGTKWRPTATHRGHPVVVIRD